MTIGGVRSNDDSKMLSFSPIPSLSSRAVDYGATGLVKGHWSPDVVRGSAGGLSGGLTVSSMRTSVSRVSPLPSSLSAATSAVGDLLIDGFPSSWSAVLTICRYYASGMAIMATNGFPKTSCRAITTALDLGCVSHAIATTRSISRGRGVSVRRRPGLVSSVVSIGGTGHGVAGDVAFICSCSTAPFSGGSGGRGGQTVTLVWPVSVATRMGVTIYWGVGRGRAVTLDCQHALAGENYAGPAGTAIVGRCALLAGPSAIGLGVSGFLGSRGFTVFSATASSHLAFAVSRLIIGRANGMGGLTVCSGVAAVWSVGLKAGHRHFRRYSEIVVCSSLVLLLTSPAKNAVTLALYFTFMAPLLMATLDAPSLVLSILAKALTAARCMTAFSSN